MDVKVKLDFRTDPRGTLVPIEGGRTIPFEIKRVYYLVGMSSDQPRGFHAHKKLVQFAICVSGSCEMHLDFGDRKEVVKLVKPTEGVLIKEMVWHEMHNFAPGTVLVVFASDYYDEKDYIRDYNDFLRLAHDSSQQ